ncbi:putative transposase [Wolbachia endosymbiont of Trichogramma pretiosum]|nr:putative transposase [Wolbachia endosymbiont of Trichogramma pretiosum]
MSHGTLAKFDKSDAMALAQYGCERHKTLSICTYFKITINSSCTVLAALCQCRDDITQMKTQEKCRLEAPKNDHIKESCQKTIEFSIIK